MKCPYCQVLDNGELEIPCNKPPVEKIIETIVDPTVDRVITIDKKVIVRGHIEIGVEYVGDVSDCSQPVHFVHFTQNFDCFIETDCVKKGMDVKVKPEIEFCEVVPAEDKIITKLIIIKITIIDLDLDDLQCSRSHKQVRYFNSPFSPFKLR
ncbi:MAG: DUF3794 domain-containing protein [Clostridiales bacterium]|nr:DUF3794 domain-containing protein [Clostridiales bacterium]MCF8022096.1 DUF3794 domain-containing protein [Clostridiales bacterium]